MWKLQFRDIENAKSSDWRDYTSAGWFKTERQARSMLMSAQVAAVRDNLAIEYRVVFVGE